jgi:gliding motility-associated-like protein
LFFVRIHILLFVLGLFAATAARGQAISLSCEQPSGCAPHGVIVHALNSEGQPATGISWTITGPTGAVLQSTANPYVAIFNTAGDYDFSVASAGVGTFIFDNYISVYSKPVAAIQVTDAGGCLPFCTQFADASVPGSGAIVEWSWDFGDGTVASNQHPSHCYTQPGTYTPVLSVEDAHGCFASVQMPQMITVSSTAPVADFQIGAQSSCSLPTTIAFTSTSTNANAYQWLIDDVVVGSTTNAVLPFTNSGSYNVCLIASNALGCTDTTCQSVSVSSQPSVSFSMESDTLCAGQTMAFHSSASPSPTSVEWDFNNDGVPNSTTPSTGYTFSNPGIYIVSMTAHFGAVCEMTVVDTVTTLTNPTIDFWASETTSCAFPFEVNFINPAASQPNSTFTWFINNEPVSTGANFSYVFNQAGVYDVRLTRENSMGCLRSRIRNNYISIVSPSLSFSHEEAICVGETLGVSDIAVSNNEAIIDYAWDFNLDGVTDALGADPDYVFSEPGEYTVALTVTTENGCVAADTSDTPLQVMAPVVPDFTVNHTETCAGQDFEYCIEYQPGNTYIWDFDDGSGPITMLPDDSCIMHTYEDTGYFDVSLTIFNGACNSMITRENFVHVVPPLALFSFDLLCDDFAVSFTNESIGADSIVWDFGDGSPLLVNVDNPIHHYPATGQYTAHLKALKHGYWCSDSKTENIIITLPIPRLSITPSEGCSPLSVFVENEKRNIHWELNAENGDVVVVDRIYIPNQPAWTIQHTHNEVTTTTYSEDPLHFDWPALIFEEPGVYDIHVSATNYNGCSADTLYQDAVVVLQGGEFAGFETQVLNPCDNGAVSVQFQATAAEAIEWQWQFSDGTTGSGQEIQHTFSQPFDYSSGLSVSLTASNSDGCQSSRNAIIPTTLPPTAAFSVSDLSVCRFEDVVFTNQSQGPEGTLFAWSFGDGSSSTATTHSYSANGNYTVCLVAMNAIGCADSICLPEPIVVNSPDAVIALSAAITNCLYTVELSDNSSGSIAQSFWDFGDNQTGSGTDVAHTYPIGVFNATLITTAENGCRDTTVAADILNYAESIGPFTQQLDTAGCAPFDIVLQAFNPNDQSFQYFWDFNDGQGDPFGGTTTQHTYNSPGTYCPSIIMTDANGCDVYVHCTEPFVVSNYQAQYSVPAQACEGSVIDVSSTNAESLTWVNATETAGGGSTNSFSVTITGNTNIIVEGGYADCRSIDTLHVNALPLPQVSLNLVDSVCYNSGVIELAGGNPVGSTGYYILNNSPATSFNTASAAGIHHTINYRYTDANGCVNTAIDSIFILPLPNIAPLEPRHFCEGDSTFVFDIDPLVNAHYTVDGVEAYAFSPLYRANPYTIGFHVEDNHGCYNEASTAFVVSPLAEVAILTQDYCSGDTLHLEASMSIVQGNITESLWTIDGAVQGAGNTSLPLVYSVGGEHDAAIRVTTDAGCVSDATAAFMVYDTPSAQFTWMNACEKDTLFLNDESTVGNDSIATWMWSIGDDSWAGNAEDFTIVENHGPQLVNLHISTEHGCTAFRQHLIEIRPMPVVALHADAHCLGQTTALNADIVLPYGGVASTAWTIEGFDYTPVGASTTFTFDAAGTFSYSFNAVSNFGCSRTVVDSVEIYPLATVEMAIERTEYCLNQNIGAGCVATVASPSTIAAYQWRIDGENAATGNPVLLQLPDIGAYEVEVEVETNHGCKTTAVLEAPIVVYPSPNAGFTWSIDQSTEQPTVVVEANTSNDVTAIAYNWGDGSNSDQSENQHTYAEDGAYEILQVVTNTFGCTADTSISIDAYNGFQFFIPDAFTPDNNTHNEFFFPVISGSYITLYVFRVYNRWGIEVFTSKQVGEGWDGTFNGEPVQDGVYTWSVDMIVRGRADLISKKGSVLLMR